MGADGLVGCGQGRQRGQRGKVWQVGGAEDRSERKRRWHGDVIRPVSGHLTHWASIGQVYPSTIPLAGPSPRSPVLKGPRPPKLP